MQAFIFMIIAIRFYLDNADFNFLSLVILLAQICRDCENIIPIIKTNYTKKCPTPSPAPPSSTPSCPESPSVCVTPACVTVAASIYNAMDVTADPCEDFYQYACGGWVDKHPLPSGHSRWGTFNVLWQENQIILKKVIGKIPSFLFNLRSFQNQRYRFFEREEDNFLSTSFI